MMQMVKKPNAKMLDVRSLRNRKQMKKAMKYWQYYILLLPAILYFAIFCYGPMYGVLIAFKNFMATKGIWGSDWVGLDNFARFFESYYFWQLIKNTLAISIYGLVVGLPLPIILALGLNELKNGKYKNLVQTVTYAPYFISVVVICGMIIAFLSPTTGIINKIIQVFGGEAIPFLSQGKWFSTVYVLSGVWQGTGWGTIVYLASLSSVDPALYEAAVLDGASKVQRIWYIDVRCIIPTIIIMLILNCGNILSIGYEKIFLLQNELNASSSEVISTYVYKTGLINAQYSFATAVGIFNSVVNLILIGLVNKIARKLSDISLW